MHHSRYACLGLLALALLLAALGVLAPGCTGQRPPQQATLALVGDFRGFQRPCG